jgi:peptidoglycan/LPS O-acetylase OafA/YrhL
VEFNLFILMVFGIVSIQIHTDLLLPPEDSLSLISSERVSRRPNQTLSQAKPHLEPKPEPKPEPKIASIDSLTGVRIVAALWVLVSHIDRELFTWFPITRLLEPVIASGFLGVDLFFILSGFIIAYNYAPRFDAGSSSEPFGTSNSQQKSAWTQMYVQFLWLRIARLYPVHLVTLLAVLVLVAASSLTGANLADDNNFGALDFVRNLFLVHAWGSYDFNWNSPAWSISAEWFAYLMFPLFALLSARVNSKWQVPVMLAVLLVLPLANLGDASNPLLNVLHLLRITTEFLAGCLLYRLHSRRAGSGLPWNIITPLSGVLTVVAAALLFKFASTSFWVVPLMALFVYGVAQQKGLLTSGLSGARMVFWGQVSYSLYMTHTVVRMVLRKLVPFAHFADASLLVRLGLLGVYLFSFAAVAALTFLLIEEPARHWLRKSMLFKKIPVESVLGLSEFSRIK